MIFTVHSLKNNTGTGEMAQWVKVLETKPGDLSLISGAHIVEGERQPSKSSSDFRVHCHVY